MLVDSQWRVCYLPNSVEKVWNQHSLLHCRMLFIRYRYRFQKVDTCSQFTASFQLNFSWNSFMAAICSLRVSKLNVASRLFQQTRPVADAEVQSRFRPRLCGNSKNEEQGAALRGWLRIFERFKRDVRKILLVGRMQSNKPPSYSQNRLLDALIGLLKVASDKRLAQMLQISLNVIQKRCVLADCLFGRWFYIACPSALEEASRNCSLYWETSDASYESCNKS